MPIELSSFRLRNLYNMFLSRNYLPEFLYLFTLYEFIIFQIPKSNL